MPTSIDNGSTAKIVLYCVLASDHLTPATGKTVAVTISKNGAAFGNPSGGATNATEIGSGWYYFTPSATDTGTNGPLLVLGTAALCDPSTRDYLVATPQAYPANFSSLAIDASGRVDVGKALGQAVTLDANNALNVSAKYWAGAAIAAASIPVAAAAGSSGGLPKVGTAPFPATGTIAGATLDEVNTANLHNVANSLGKQVRLINPNSDVIYSSTLPSQAGVAANAVKLDTGASAADGAYVGTVLSCISGTGQGSKICVGYTGSTRLAVLDSAWSVAPIAADVVEVTPSSKAQVIGYATGSDPAALVWIYTTRTLTGLAI